MKKLNQLTMELVGKITGKGVLLSGIKLMTLALLTITGCKKESIPIKIPSSGGHTSLPTTDPGVICGKSYIKGMYFGLDSVGKVQVSNSSSVLLVKYNVNANWLLKSTKLYAGSCDSIPYDGLGIPAAGQFPYQKTYTTLLSSDTYQIPFSKVNPCYCIIAQATLVKIDVNGSVVDSITIWSKGTKSIEMYDYFFKYCKQECADTCVIKPGDFRTQTQGGWGSTPHGNNPGTYLHKNFAGAFPNGLVVGCSLNTLKFTTAQAITDYLPDGGSGAVLTQSYINPVGLKNVLAAQIVALSISVQFDLNNPNFGASAVSMSNLVIGTGVFKGWTVTKVLAEANQVLGGCSSSYTSSQMINVISSINENFVDGTKNNGFLTCQ